MSDEKKGIEQVERAVEISRQAGEKGSKQPRFSEIDVAYGTIFDWAKKAEQNAPPYSTNSRRRDKWLRVFWKLEAHLSGVLSSVVAIDKNRGWLLLGGRNQVSYYEALLRRSENGAGWRRYISKQALSFYTADLGFVTETERESIPGRLVNLYHVDPARCRLIGGPKNKIEYSPSGGSPQTWQAFEDVTAPNGRSVRTPADFFRGVSMPSTDERFLGLGYCAVSRALQMAQLMIAVMQYDREKLGAQAPQGLLFLYNISQSQWIDAMKARKADLDSRERDWFSGVATIASSSLEQADAKLVGLSQLPENFSREQFIEFLMYGYALCFGYDAGEFWPKMRSGLSSGQEVGVQHAKATGKGGLDFALEFQTRLQQQLPLTIHYEFEQRDDEGELKAAQVQQQKADVVTTLYESGLQQGASLISRAEARSMLARMGIIPDDWTEFEEDISGTDTQASRLKMYREQARESPYVQNAIYRFPNEPIVRFYHPSDPFKKPNLTVLWDAGSDAFRPQAWPGAKLQARQLTVKRQEVLYQGDDFQITTEDVDEALAEAGERVGAEFVELLTAEEIEV